MYSNCLIKPHSNFVFGCNVRYSLVIVVVEDEPTINNLAAHNPLQTNPFMTLGLVDEPQLGGHQISPLYSKLQKIGLKCEVGT